MVASSMIIRDPLYEEFEIPAYLDGLLSCWELRRLRNVRLINVNSLPLSVLGETSRYSHTLGVLQLGIICLKENEVSLDSPQARLLLSALALHDAGTPAFGHSLEYVLKEGSKRDHVDAIIGAIDGAQTEGNLHWSCAPPHARHKKLKSELKRLLGPDYVGKLTEALKGKGPVGHLVSSKTIDLDNIDNVFRMAAALGIRDWSPEDPVRIARSLVINQSNDCLNCRDSGIENIKRWAFVRRKVYEILNLHPQNLSGLAMLRQAFEIHVEDKGSFPSSAWWTVDSEILDNLSTFAGPITDRIKRGDLYNTLHTMWVDTSNSMLAPLETLTNKLRLFSNSLSEILDHRVRVHAISDRGTFERSINLFSMERRQCEIFGKTSHSIIISVHSQSRSNNYPSRDKVERVTIALLADCFGVQKELVRDSYLLPASQLSYNGLGEAHAKQFNLWN